LPETADDENRIKHGPREKGTDRVEKDPKNWSQKTLDKKKKQM
jgi:hypothetical protein